MSLHSISNKPVEWPERSVSELEKGEPLAIELRDFVDSVAKARQPKVGAALGKSALEVAIAITEQIRTAHQAK